MKQLRAFVTGLLIFAVVLVAALGIMWAVGAEYDRAPETTTTINNETVIVDEGNWTDVGPDYALYFYDNETVRDSSGNTMTEGEDYEFNTTNGSVYWYESTLLGNDGEEATITHSYRSKTQEVRQLMTVLSVPIRYVLPVGVLVVLATTVAVLGIGLYLYTGSRLSGGSRGSGSFSRR